MKKLVLTAAIAALSFNALADPVTDTTPLVVLYNNPLQINVELKDSEPATLKVAPNSSGNEYLHYVVNAGLSVTATNAKNYPQPYSIELTNLDIVNTITNKVEGKFNASVAGQDTSKHTKDVYFNAGVGYEAKKLITHDSIGEQNPFLMNIQLNYLHALPAGTFKAVIPIVVTAI